MGYDLQQCGLARTLGARTPKLDRTALYGDVLPSFVGFTGSLSYKTCL